MISPVDRSRRKASLRLPVAFLATAAFVAGCSALPPLGGLLESDGTKAAASAPGATYYTGEAGLKLYPAPHFASSPITTLPLHQKVYRSKIEKGFAYVRVDGTGQLGWVDNAKLIWRLPQSPAAEPETTSAPATEPERDSAEPAADQIPAAPEEPATGLERTVTEDTPADTLPPEATEDVDPSVFNPF